MPGPEPIPRVSFVDLFSQDGLLQALLRSWLGRDAYASLRPRFDEMGRIAADATPLSALADRHRPRLVTHDARGERVDEVVYHPSYHALERMAYGAGIVATKYDPSFLARHRSHRHLVGFTLGYLFAQTEMSLFCPICMTDGVGRVLERFAPHDAVARQALHHVASTDLKTLWQGAMFLTERQGGSDVGANSVQARRDGDGWVLDGDKWFCSNVDAEAILVLARMPDAAAASGTRGLGLFLVLRHRPEGNGRTIEIHRLKDKLGVASMATGEVTLRRTRAHLIGGANEGFKMMAEMLNLSRIYNSVAAVGAMRRATIEALAYGRVRSAFGRPLVELPLWRATMADLIAESMGALVLVFETVRSLDRADAGDTAAQGLVRLLTPTTKAMTGKLTTFVTSEAMEAVGGNAYIEEHIMPRLLRDAQVLPIWEGTTNVLALDVLRVLADAQVIATLEARVHAALAAATSVDTDPVDPGLVDGVRADLSGLWALTERIRAADRADQERAARGWMEKAARVLSKALLLEAAATPALRGPAVAAARRLHARAAATQPVAGAYSAVVDGTEEPLLDAWLR